MKIASRITYGYVVLLLLIGIVVGVQTFGYRQIRKVDAKNLGDNLRITLVAIDLVRDIDEMDEQSHRYYSSRDANAKDDLKESQQRFQDAFQEVKSYRGSERKQAETDRLERFWNEYLGESAKAAPIAQARPGTTVVYPDLSDALARLRTQSITVYQALLGDARNQAAESRKSSERIESIVWWSGWVALVLGILLSSLIIRSVAGPLRALSDGTRAIAEGKGFYRLDTSRRDELSQIAKDFNTLVERLKEYGNAEEAQGKKYEL